jgi:mannitol/fructose-specific phosphotransferase system IIA component (Ntr-type)
MSTDGSLATLLDPRLIEVELTGASVRAVLEPLLRRIVTAGILRSSEDALRRLEEREKVASTGIGGGVAIPHARTPEVRRTILAVGRSREGVPFNAIDGQPVRVVFLILGPPEASAEHVRVLGRIARLVKQPAFLPGMAEAGSAEAVMALLRSCT